MSKLIDWRLSQALFQGYVWQVVEKEGKPYIRKLSLHHSKTFIGFCPFRKEYYLVVRESGLFAYVDNYANKSIDFGIIWSLDRGELAKYIRKVKSKDEE